MSNRTMNTHRRQMRAVTPVGRLGRNAAGAAIAAGILVGGAGAANAGGEAKAENVHAEKAPRQVAPEAKPAVALTVLDGKGVAPVSMDAAKASPSAVELEVPKPVVAVENDAADSSDQQSADREDSTRDDSNGDDRSSQRSARDASDGEDRSSQRSDRSDRSANRTRANQDDSSDEQSADDSSASSAPSSQADYSGGSIVSTARNGIGVNYVYGGSTRGGWDCSGFTAWVYAQHGISLPHSAAGQRSMGTVISKSEARPGDLVYTPGHIGIYAGNGRIIDAGTSAGTTSERAMWPASWTYVRIS